MRQVRPRWAFWGVFDKLFEDGHAEVDPRLARMLGKEFGRLGMREHVFIGRDDSYGKTMVVLLGARGRKQKNGRFEVFI